MQNLKNILAIAGTFLFLLKGLTASKEINSTLPPHVPPHTSRIMPEIVVVNFTAKEFIGPLGAGKNYKFWATLCNAGVGKCRACCPRV